MDGMSWIVDLRETFADWSGIAVEAGVYAGLLAVVVLSINVLFRRRLTAGQMGLLWGLVLVRLVVPIVPSSSLSLENLFVAGETQPESARLATQPKPSGPVDPQRSRANVQQLTELNLPTASPEESYKSLWLDAVFMAIPLVWAVVGIAGLVYTVASYVRFCRRVNQVAECCDTRLLRMWDDCRMVAGVRRAGRVIQFDGVDQPAVMGLWSPTLLLPRDAANLNDQQLQMVMLHELAHVRRWDIAGNWLMVVIRAIHWWNPIYWLAAARFRGLREQACDAFVVRSLKNDSSRSYSDLLLSLAERRPNVGTWRVMLPASILSFFPSLFRRRAVRVRLKALRGANAKRGRWQMACASMLLVALVVSGFTVAREEIEKPMDLPTWMASHADVVLASKRSYEVPKVFEGRRETREYEIAKVLEEVGKEAGSKSAQDSQKVLEITLKQMYCRNHSGNAPPSDNYFGTYQNPTDSKVAAKTVSDVSPLTFTISGSKLSATAPVGLHDDLRRVFEAWSEHGMTQISVETRFLSSNRDLVSDLGVSWQFLEAFSSERENAFPSAGHDGGPVVHAEARVDEYLPLVVSTLNEQQAAKLLELAHNDRSTNVLNAPKITIFNGTEAIIADCVERPFVVGVFQRTAGATEPKVVVLEEGTKIKIRAALGQKNVRLQASLEMKALGDVTTASTKFRGSPVSIQVPSVNRRCIDVGADLKNGETLLVGSIPTGKQQQYLYYLLSARTIAESGDGN